MILRVFRVGTRLTVHHPLDIQKLLWTPWGSPPAPTDALDPCKFKIVVSFWKAQKLWWSFSLYLHASSELNIGAKSFMKWWFTLHIQFSWKGQSFFLFDNIWRFQIRSEKVKEVQDGFPNGSRGKWRRNELVWLFYGSFGWGRGWWFTARSTFTGSACAVWRATLLQ